MPVMCVSCVCLHTVIIAGEAAVCTSPKWTVFSGEGITIFPIGLPVITRYYKNTWNGNLCGFHPPSTSQCRHDSPAVDSKEVEC